MLARHLHGLFVAFTCIAPAIRAQAASLGTVRVRNGTRETLLTVTDLRALPRHQLRVAAENSTDSSTVAGISLWDVLQKAGIPSPEASGRQRAATYVRLVAADGQTALFALVELDPGFSRKTVLVADQRNGQPLDASEGPWRVFVPDEARHARWVRDLVRIDVGTLPPQLGRQAATEFVRRVESMPASSHHGGWRRPSALFPLAGFVVSLVVHALTYAGIDVSRGFPLVWALHVGAILAFGAMMVGGRRNRRAGGFELPNWPAWAYLLAAAALFYAFVNFMRFFALSQGGTPEVTAGGYVLSDHGRVIRSLTEAEYWRQKAYILRGFSGHWMFFFLLPALHFALRRTERDRASTPAPAA